MVTNTVFFSLCHKRMFDNVASFKIIFIFYSVYKRNKNIIFTCSGANYEFQFNFNNLICSLG